MEIGPLKIHRPRDTSSIRIAVITGIVLCSLLLVGGSYDLIQRAHSTLGLPLEFKLRQLMEVTPKLSERLKIISLDDSTYAYMQKPNLTGEDWAKILQTIGAASPSAIITSHMFGSGEFESTNDHLSQSITKLKNQGVEIITGSFAYPLKISFRKPLPLDRAEFQISSIDKGIPTANLPGWTIYGPDAPYAHKFSRIGHLGYDGNSRIPAYIKISDTHIVPHISLLAPGTFKSQPIDSKGRLIVNYPNLTHITKIAKSMKFLMSDGESWAKKVIQRGDIVLILSEMYTGKVNFVETPIGSLPASYAVVSALNSSITGQWLNDGSGKLYIIAIFLGLGLTCGLAPNLFWFAASFAIGLVLIPAIGILSFSVQGTIIPWVTSSFFFSVAAGALFLRRSQEKLSVERKRNSKIEKEKDKLNAIVRTAQMFAHDVRKPFSMLHMTAQSIQKITDADKIKSLMSRMLPELNRAMTSVEGMIRDIMEIDAKSSEYREQTDIVLFLGECLQDGFRLRNAKSIEISYDFRHTLDVDIDRLRVKRVILNIIDNAIQAMGTKGRIWVRSIDSTDSGKAFVEVTIGNADTYIEPDHIERIFEAFYTSGKKNGTGLGLAIAQKVVVEHGGKIFVKSNKELGTEFTFSLPVCHSTPVARKNHNSLPLHSSIFCEFKLFGVDERVNHTEESFATVARLKSAKESLNRLIKVLVIDDEQIYLESMRTILTNGFFADLVEIEVADSSDRAIAVSAEFKPDFILCDIDMGINSLSGFNLVHTLRDNGDRSIIIMHSNRTFLEDSNKASLAGANYFLPKPMNESKFADLVISELEKTKEKSLQTSENYKDIVVVVDDDIFALEAWATLLDDAEIMTFESPTLFWQYLAANKAFINDIKLIITDFYFDNETHENGESFAVKIKAIGNIPVLLSSNASFSSMPSIFDGVIGKEPMSYREIDRKIGKKAS